MFKSNTSVFVSFSRTLKQQQRRLRFTVNRTGSLLNPSSGAACELSAGCSVLQRDDSCFVHVGLTLIGHLWGERQHLETESYNNRQAVYSKISISVSLLCKVDVFWWKQDKQQSDYTLMFVK